MNTDQKNGAGAYKSNREKDANVRGRDFNAPFHLRLTKDRDVQIDYRQAAIAAGAVDEGAPGPRPEYGEPYYGCFVRDLDGHKIEAAYWDAALMEQLYGSGE